jgi:DNA primase
VAAIHDDAKEQVRQATDIVDLIGKYIELRRQGRGYVGRCKWHDDRKPSLQVNPERQTWKCWVCDIGGDAFSFVMKNEGCDFREALDMLAQRAGIQIGRGQQRKAEPGSPDDKNTLYAACDWAARQFHECLLKSDSAKAARDYVQERAITPASVERFNVGFAPDEWTWLADRARNTPYSPKVLEAAGLVGQSERGGYYDRFKGRLIFPIRDTQGRTIAFGGRVLPGNTDPRAGKYVNCPETRLYKKNETLYALDIARNHTSTTRKITVVEGYTDVILAHQGGVGDVVACCGTAVTDRHIHTLKHFADTIFLVLDGDDAGQRRTSEILSLFVSSRIDLRIVTLPEELDPAEYVVERGGDAFREEVSRGRDALHHRIDVAARGVDLLNDPNAASRVAEDVLSTIASAMVHTDHDLYRLRAKTFALTVARRLSLELSDVQDRLEHMLRDARQRRPKEIEEVVQAEYTAAMLSSCERELLEILALHPELAPVALAEIAEEDLASAVARAILATYRRREEAGESLDFGPVLAEIENASLKNVLVAIDEQAHEKSPKAILDGPTRLRSVIRNLQQHHEQRELRQTETALEQKVFQPEEEHNVLLSMIAAKRRQQGLAAPLEG